MMKNYLWIPAMVFFALFTNQSLQAQANCGATAGQLQTSATPISLLVTDTTPPQTFVQQPVGLPDNDFLITQVGNPADDALGDAIVGVSVNGEIHAPDAGLTVGDDFDVYIFSYDLQQVKDVVHALFNESFLAGVSCCQAAEQLIPNFCANMSANGISDSSDVQDISDLFVIMNAFAGTGGTLSVPGVVAAMNDLNANIALFGNCSGGVAELCYAVDIQAYSSYTVTGVPVGSISVQGQGGVNIISTPNGTLQMEATVQPMNATAQDVTWSVQNLSGVATIDANGLLTAFSDGNVEVTATATDGTGISGSAQILINNQTNVPVSSITVTPNPASISTAGGSVQMGVTIAPMNASVTNVIWTVEAGGFLGSIDANGLFTSYNNNDGMVTVRATSTDGSNVFGEATIDITNQGVISVTNVDIDQDTAYITTLNGTYQFSASILPVDATNTNLAWNVIGNPSSADINNLGLATGYAEDTVLVTATSFDGNITDTSVLIINTTVGVFNFNHPELSLDVAPNPFVDNLSLTLDNPLAEQYTISLNDLTGRVIQSQEYDLGAGRHVLQLETNNLPSGIYWLQVHTPRGMTTTKVIKE